MKDGPIAMTTVSYGCVAPEGRTFPNQLLVTKDNTECIENLKTLTRAVHEKSGAAISIQLTHAGLMAEPVGDAIDAKNT